MKRRNIIILLGTLIFSVVGYVAWCGRCFYLRQALVMPPETPPEVHALYEDWYGKTHIDLRTPLSRQTVIHHLTHPGSDRNRELDFYHKGTKRGASRWWDLTIERDSGLYEVTVTAHSEEPLSGWSEGYTAFLQFDKRASLLDGEEVDWVDAEPCVPLPPDVAEKSWRRINKRLKGARHD